MQHSRRRAGSSGVQSPEAPSLTHMQETWQVSLPLPPSTQSETVIAQQSTAATYPEELAEQGMTALAAVRKVLDDKDTPEDISMDELLTKANVSHSIYLCGLKMCSTGSSIVMQRKSSESWINTYNRANMDLQFVLDPYAYACVMYIAAYMLKSECSMGELLKQVSKECSGEQIRTQLRHLGSKGFAQLVKVSTTDSGSLLDYIYYNGNAADAVVHAFTILTTMPHICQ